MWLKFACCYAQTGPVKARDALLALISDYWSDEKLNTLS